MLRLIITLILFPLASLAFTPYQGGVSSPSTELVGVALLYDTGVPESVAAAQYYQASRNIRSDHMIGIAVTAGSPSGPTKDSIPRADFDSQIRIPLESALTVRGIDDVVSVIVAFPGIPQLVIDASADPSSDARASVIQELALLFTSPAQHGSPGNGGCVGNQCEVNTYRSETRSFEKWRQTSGPTELRYMTARLTAYHDVIDAGTGVSVDLKNLIDRARQDRSLTPVALIDKGGTSIAWQAADFDGFETQIAAFGVMPVAVDAVQLLARNVSDIAFYVSNGSNAGGGNAAPFYGLMGADLVPGTFSPGALTVDAVSTNARSFVHPPVYGQSLVADLIRAGASGVIGAVREPFLLSVPDPALLFDSYVVQNRPAVEAFWRTSRTIGWMMEYVGDPLMTWSDASPPGQVLVACLLDTCQLDIGVLQ